jgi:hypothetical protein
MSRTGLDRAVEEAGLDEGARCVVYEAEGVAVPGRKGGKSAMDRDLPGRSTGCGLEKLALQSGIEFRDGRLV